MSDLAAVDAEGAREYSESLAMIGKGWVRQIQWAYQQGIPEAEGLSRVEWRKKYYGDMKLGTDERREEVRELTDAGHTAEETAQILGVTEKTVDRDRAWLRGTNVPDESDAHADEQDSRESTRGQMSLPAGQGRADAILAEFDAQHANPSPLPDGPRYCKYCYGEHEFAIGDDGSLIVCGSCGAGVAPLDEAIAHGGYDAFKAYITREFERAAAGTPDIEPEPPRVQLNEGDEWYTPQWLFDALGIEKYWADVCAPLDRTHSAVPAERHFTVDDDGLAQPWHGTVWCNPPYSKPEPWARRMIHHRDGLLLTHIPMNAGWCIEMWEACDAIRLFQAMEFVRPDGSTQRPGYWLQLAAFGPAAMEALARLQPLGQAAANKRRVASPMWRRAA